MQIIDDMLTSRLQDDSGQTHILMTLRSNKGPAFLQAFLAGLNEDKRTHADAVRASASALTEAGADPVVLSDCIGAAIELGVHDAIAGLVSAAIALDGPQKTTGGVS